ncbi:hypothetical protein [Nocardia aurantiaca]|uniref:Uncharacterized protein n=1 Tax=Nocardia aurantiaca TaxID=2675850 RepID=A0A6I3KXN9_9NOCA|nr:hypothetical protein [Nocardia aurantiaca]MTE13416.1 hypothetical protein [Nocardia aurantiaca]
MTGPIEQALDATQLTVARARAEVLQGCGPDASPAEQAAAQHDRDLLGALPAPLERELVHLATTLIRQTPHGPISEPLRAQFDRLRTAWQVPEGPATARLRRRDG